MALTRAYEEHEVGPEIRRIYNEVRTNFDLPFVPSLFKSCAAAPNYLKGMWRDLGPVVASREFQAAAAELDKDIRSIAIAGSWRMHDQERMLAEQKISTSDMPVLAGVVGVFARTLPRMLLFAMLMQRGYSGGQKGSVSAGKQAPALSRLITLHVPNEKEASLRVWLIYSDFKRTTKSKSVLSLYRALSPFPGYLGSAWMDSKRLLADRELQSQSEQIGRRAATLLRGLPVKNHRVALNSVTASEWRDIEEVVENYLRIIPSFSLLATVWRRSFSDAVQSRAA